jgi:hypothetical protein
MKTETRLLLVIMLLCCAAMLLLSHVVTQKMQYAASLRAAALVDSLARVDRARIDSLHVLEVQLAEAKASVPPRHIITQQRARVDSLYSVLPDSVLQAYEIIPAQQQLIQEQAATIDALDRVVALQDDQLRLQAAMLTDLRTSNASLQRTITELRIPKKDKLLGITLPSRTSSMVIGIAIGAVAVSRM